MRKRFSAAWILALALCASVALCGPARAAYWTEGNDGLTEATAYVIDSIEDLRELRDNVNAGTEPRDRYYRLASDFNMTQETDWVPIGNVDHPFEGHFDGAGKTLHVDITRTGSNSRLGNDYAALFGYLAPASGYAVKGLNVDGSVSARHWAAGIARTLSSGTIEDCRFTGKVEQYYHWQSEIGTSRVAGIVAEMTGGTIRNCTVTGTINSPSRGYSGDSGWAGGIVAQMTGGNIEDCHVLSGSTVSALPRANRGTTYAGGIVAQANLALTEAIRNCTVDATVSATTYTGGIVGEMSGGRVEGNKLLGESKVSATFASGGIVGQMSAGGTAEDNDVAASCWLSADGDSAAAGGIVGLLDTGTVRNNTSRASISRNAPHQGGIIGKIDGAVTTISGNRYSGAEYGIGFNASGYPSDEGCERIGGISVITITTGSVPGGTVGQGYSFALQATGAGTIVWTLDGGALPNGLDLSPSGVISGTPTAAGTSTFTVRASNASTSDVRQFSITIASSGPAPIPSAVTIVTNTISSGMVGQRYSFLLQATGTGTIVWTLDGGALPVGLDLGHDGVISGTPTTSGTFTFTVRATSGTASDAKRFSITIASGGKKPDDKEGGGGCDTGLGALALMLCAALALSARKSK